MCKDFLHFDVADVKDIYTFSIFSYPFKLARNMNKNLSVRCKLR